jgi:hypothetical protein
VEVTEWTDPLPQGAVAFRLRPLLVPFGWTSGSYWSQDWSTAAFRAQGYCLLQDGSTLVGGIADCE